MQAEESADQGTVSEAEPLCASPSRANTANTGEYRESTARETASPEPAWETESPEQYSAPEDMEIEFEDGYLSPTQCEAAQTRTYTY